LRRETIYFKDVMTSDVFQESISKLTLVIGKDITGEPAVQDLAKTPHLLMAGSTGSGKSVGLNAMICSILLNATPDEVKMMMIDPKMLELSIYDGIPHLISPVVTNPKKAAAALQWAVNEMESRYKMMADCGVRNINGFNEYTKKLQKEYDLELKRRDKANAGVKPKSAEDVEEDEDEDIMPEPPAKLPYIVILIDELADLMMVASKGVEESLTRLAQMARAAGIHLIVATQRPSVDVLTGIIKANFPTRMSYKVTSRVDSRTILDAMGADKLLGKGDMLFLPPGTSKLHRLHGVMVSDEEIQRIVDYIKKQGKPHYLEDIFDSVVENVKSGGEEEEPFDEKYDEALAIVAKDRQASISYIQRRLRIGYNRAARIIETMEQEGVVGPSDGVRPREVYVSPIEIE
jgi:S-DNA-T family DNA segregation ATPase FtsK/SpoIIIE